MIVIASVFIATQSLVADENPLIVMDPAPFLSPRPLGMAGAASTIVEDIDALYYNPAGIGGQDFGKKQTKNSFIRKVYFPYVSVSANENAETLLREMNKNGARSDVMAGEAATAAHSGDRQYLRGSLSAPGFIVGRLAVLPVYDMQGAAVSKATSQDTDITLKYRNFSGVLVGGSIVEPKGRFYIGASTKLGVIEDFAGTFKYSELVDAHERRKIMKSNRKKYDAGGINLGAILRAPKAWSPSLSIVARNMGDTTNRSRDSKEASLIEKEDLTVGFSLSPQVGKWGQLHWVNEASELSQQSTSMNKKLRTGLELRLGADSPLAVRCGYAKAGAAYGATINLGLIGIEASSHAVDIGPENNSIIERRNAAAVFINPASF